MIVVTADVHAHNFTDFNTQRGGKNSRLAATLHTLQVMLEYAIEHKAEAFLVIGDLFHSQTKIDINVLDGVAETLQKFAENGIQVVLLSGNHDQYLKDGSCNSLKQLSGIATIVSEPTVVNLSDCDIYAVPYIDDQEDLEASLEEMSAVASKAKKYAILASHVAIDGSYVGSFEHKVKTHTGVKKLHPDSYDLCLLGHHHKPQEISDGVFYVGSPLQHDRGERGEAKTFWAVRPDDNDGDIESIPTGAPEFVKLTKEEYDALSDEQKANLYPEIIVNSVEDHKAASSELANTNAKIVMEDIDASGEEGRIVFDANDTLMDKTRKYAEFKGQDSDVVEEGIKLLTEVM